MLAQLKVEEVPLNAADRCDRCRSQAYVRATMSSGFDLLFCIHHYKEADKEGVLTLTASHIYDESHRVHQRD